MSSLKEKFEEAATKVKTGKMAKTPSNEDKLKIYGLYKQGIEGDNTKPAPGFFSGFEDTAKWNAWTAQKGKSKEDAMKEYIAEVERQLVAYA